MKELVKVCTFKTVSVNSNYRTSFYTFSISTLKILYVFRHDCCLSIIKVLQSNVKYFINTFFLHI